MYIKTPNNIEEHYFNGFRYFKDAEHCFPKIEHSKQYPSFLYKYYSFSEKSLNALKSSYLYASHPYQLNDILDSSIFLFYTSEPYEFKIYKKVLGKVINNREKLKDYYLNDIKPENNCNGYIECLYHLLSKSTV